MLNSIERLPSATPAGVVVGQQMRSFAYPERIEAAVLNGLRQNQETGYGATGSRQAAGIIRSSMPKMRKHARPLSSGCRLQLGGA
jgi:hypothetical protein